MRLGVLYCLLVLVPVMGIGKRRAVSSDIYLGAVLFRPGSKHLTKESRAKLDSVVATLDKNPESGLVAIVCGPDLCATCDILSWDRVNVVVGFLKRRGISESRLEAMNKFEGNYNAIELYLVPLASGPDPHPALTLKDK